MRRAGGSTGRPPGEAILRVEDLVHHFRVSRWLLGGRREEVQAVRGVSFDLLKGECLGIVGESGSGKTTLARCLVRLLEPTGGTVRFRGEDVYAMDRQALTAFRKKVQIVFQDPYGSLNPRLMAGTMLEEVLEVHARHLPPAERRSRAGELLHLVGLHSGHGGRFPHEFSGGQRQRLGIARALAVDPELLILDEPVSALDLSVRAQILSLLSDLRERLALSLILVAHDLSVIRQVADRALILYLGKTVETGPLDGLFRNPLHPYTRGLLAAADPGPEATWRPGDWRLLSGDPPSPSSPPPGCPLFPRCPHPERDDECRQRAPVLSGESVLHRVACWKEAPGPARP